MPYITEKPEVIGHFDPDFLNSEIEDFVSGIDPDDIYDIRDQFELSQRKHSDAISNIKDIARIEWRCERLLRSFKLHDSNMGGERVEDLEAPTDSRIDNWHVDTMTSGKTYLTEIITGASRWPTEFLVGRLVIEKSLFEGTHNPSQVFSSPEGKSAIDAAIQAGDIDIVSFEPGQVVHVAKGSLHRRPATGRESGYRFFFKHFASSSFRSKGRISKRFTR